MKILGHRQYDVPSYVVASPVHVGLVAFGSRVGAVSEVAPLKNKPTIATKGDISDYMRLIANVHDTLMDSMNGNLVTEDPDKVHGRAEELARKAYNIDGCMGPLSCNPNGTEEEPGLLSYAQWSYRNQYWHELLRARFLEDIIKRRGMKKEDIQKDLALSAALDSWTERYEAQNKKMSSWSAVDWDEVERLDLDLQKIRNEYQIRTGIDLGGLPSKTPTPTGGVPWTGILMVAGLIAGAVIIGQSASIVRLFKSAPAPLPSPAS